MDSVFGGIDKDYAAIVALLRFTNKCKVFVQFLVVDVTETLLSVGISAGRENRPSRLNSRRP